MPKRIFEQSPITINGIEVSCDVESAELLLGRREAVNMTGLCDTWEQFGSPNIKRWGVRLNYFTNFDATSTGSATTAGIYYALLSVLNSTLSSGVSFLQRSSTAARSVTNPEWSGLVQIDGDFGAFGGAIAEAAKGSVTLKGMGTLTFITSSS